MKRIPISEANQKFTGMIKTVDKEGIVEITRREKGEYILMTKENYEREIALATIKNEIWGSQRGEDDKIVKLTYAAINDNNEIASTTLVLHKVDGSGEYCATWMEEIKAQIKDVKFELNPLAIVFPKIGEGTTKYEVTPFEKLSPDDEKRLYAERILNGQPDEMGELVVKFSS